jgi:hypothetical protein
LYFIFTGIYFPVGKWVDQVHS